MQDCIVLNFVKVRELLLDVDIIIYIVTEDVVEVETSESGNTPVEDETIIAQGTHFNKVLIVYHSDTFFA